MCGIAGIWNRDGKPVPEDVILGFTNSLSHRGPDGYGIHIEDGLALGHRRLKILDLTDSGRQPMEYAGGRYRITYNGEIYNFLELRRELEAKGHRFVSQTDTEVILASFDAWGPDCLFRFNGMWAFAIWDRTRRVLFLARDRFGVKPLYYFPTPHSFAFASEMKAFLSLDGFDPEADWPVFRAELEDPFRQEAGERCLLKGVSRLPAGHHAFVSSAGVSVRRWWNTLDHLEKPPPTPQGQEERFRELFFDSVRIRMRSDVPVGTCLSGGLDSSAVLCAMSRISRSDASLRERLATNWQRAFVATFPGTPLDERRYAEEAVREAGANAIYLDMDPADSIAAVEASLFHLEDIYGGMTAPVYRLYESVRRGGIVVSLDGHGADELLGGYDFFVRDALRDVFWPVQNLENMPTLLRMLHGMYGPGAQVNRYKASLYSVLGAVPGVRRIAGAFSRRRKEGRNPWLGPLLRETVPAAPVEDPAGSYDGHLNRSLYNAFHAGVLPAILRNFDRMSMAHGVEVRMPFMDWRLVTFAFSLPGSSKIGEGYTKLILRRAMRDVLPPLIRDRKDKIGFNAPMVDWFQGPMKSWLEDTMRSAAFGECPAINPAAIRNYYETKTRGAGWRWDDTYRFWPYINAFLWLERFTKKRDRS